jgi:hypothetical protein
VQYYEGKITEMEEEIALAVQQAVDESVSLKLRKLQTRLENMEKESRDLREVHFLFVFWNKQIYFQISRQSAGSELSDLPSCEYNALGGTFVMFVE